MIATAVTELASVVGTSAACIALAVSRATHYRRTRRPRLDPPAPRPRPARANGVLGGWARSTMMTKGDPVLHIADQLAAICRGAAPVPARAPWRSITLPSRYPLPGRVIFELRRHLLPLLPPPASPEIEAEYLEDVAALGEVPDRLRRWQPILDDYLASREARTE